MLGHHHDSASICRPCRRAQRRHRDEHRCYGAVLGEDRADATTWVACACDCQRTLVAMGFYEGHGQPPAEVVPAPMATDAQSRGLGPDTPAAL